MKPYISGPIAGSPHMSRDEKLTRFARAELVLRQMGHEPVNPLHVAACEDQQCNPNGGYHPDGAYRHDWACWLKYDLIEMLAKADSIAMLPEWQTSEGAMLEREVATRLNWPVIDLTHSAIVMGLPHEIQEIH